MRYLIENGRLFKPTKKTVITESNAKANLPATVYDYVKLDNGETLLKVEGVVADYTEVNGNNRFYSKEVWENVLNSKTHIMKDIEEQNAWGVQEHPENGETHIGKASHRLLSLKDNGNGSIIAEVLIVNSDEGRNLRAKFESGGTVGISSRGYGDTVQRNGREEVLPGYVCETFDFVKTNSVPTARFNTSINAERAASVAKGITQESLPAGSVNESTSLASDSVVEASESKQGESKQQVNSCNDDSHTNEQESLKQESIVMKEFNLRAFELEVSNLKSIAESATMDNFQLETVLVASRESINSIEEAQAGGKIKKNEAEKLITRYNSVVESAQSNSPSARELAELKSVVEMRNKRYEALKKISEGILERHHKLMEDYKSIEAGSTDGASLTEGEVKSSKRYQALLSIAEELMKRTVQSGKVLEKAKARMESVDNREVSLLKKKLLALESKDLSEKAINLIRKCETVGQIDRVLDRVKSIKESGKGAVVPVVAPFKKVEAKVKKTLPAIPKLESQAHKEPLPGDKISEGAPTASRSDKDMHESISVISRMRKLRK